MIEDTSRQIEGIHPSPNPLEPPREQPRQGRGGLRTGAIIGLILVLIVVFVVGGFAGWVYAGTKSSSSSSTTNATTLDALRESVAAKVRPSIVEVYVTLTNGAALGSGVIVNSQGYIVTNNQVVSGATTMQVRLSNGTKEAAQLAGADAAYDLAVLKIAVPQGGLTVATLGDSTQLKVVFFSSRRRHPMFDCDWSSDVCSSDLPRAPPTSPLLPHRRARAPKAAIRAARSTCSSNAPLAFVGAPRWPQNAFETSPPSPRALPLL